MKVKPGIYIGGPSLEPPEDLVMIRCDGCHKSAYSAEWKRNRGHCPLCHKAYAGPEIEED